MKTRPPVLQLLYALRPLIPWVVLLLVLWGACLAWMALSVFYSMPSDFQNPMLLTFLVSPLAYGSLTVCFMYGILRGLFYHPVFDKGYRDWLATTPWTANHSFPRGPIHPVMSDLIFVGVLNAISSLFALWIGAQGLEQSVWPYVLCPFVLFALALAIVWTVANAFVGQTTYVYAAAGMPVLFAVVGTTAIGFLICPFLMAGIAWLGVRRSLEEFPWKERENVMDLTKIIQQQASPTLGWPFKELLQPAREIRTTIGRALTEAAIVGGWLWLAIDLQARDIHRVDLATAMLIGGIAATVMILVRLLVYAPVICSRMCWGQRLANRKLLIWRHDEIFIAILMIGFAGLAIPWYLYDVLEISVATASGVAAGVVVLIGRTMGPSVEELRLTGVHSKSGKVLFLSNNFTTPGGSNP